MMNWVISSSVLILVIIALRAVLKGKISLRLQYGLWALVLIRLLFPFSIGETVMSIGNWMDSAGDTVQGQQFEEFVQTPLPNISYEEAFESVADKYYEQGIHIESLPKEELSESIQIEVENTMRGGHTPEEIASMIWVAGAIVLGLWFFVTNIHFSLKLRKERVFLGKIERLCIYQANSIETPCLYGLFTPAIYVTDEVIGQEEKMRHVLEHECTHYRHGDYIWSVLRVVCLAMHWYNPLVWCAAILSRNDAELACDEATIRRLGETERTAYGRTLIGLTCEKRSAILITATTMTGSGKSIKERIKLIAQKPKMAEITLIAVVLLAAVAVIWTYTDTKPPYENFTEWAKTLDADKFETFAVCKGYGDTEIRYQGYKIDFVKFYKILKTTPEEKCYRRKQTVETYEDYYAHFSYEGKDVIFHCLEDKTLLFVGDSEMPQFAPEGKDLIINNPELWNYIVDTVNERGKNEYTGNSSVEESVHYETTADLNHDGIKDLLKVVTGIQVNAKWKFGTHIEVFLGKADGTYQEEAVYKSENVYDSRSQNGTFVLSQRDGKDYLVYSVMYEDKETASYEYAVMCLSGTEVVTVQSEKAKFVTDPFKPSYWEGNARKDKVPQMKKALEPWIQNATILASYDVDTPKYIISESNKVPASTYYDSVWARNDDERLKEYYAKKEEEEKFWQSMEEWERVLYQMYFGTEYDEIRAWFETQITSDYSQWYREYDGSNLQRIDKHVHIPNAHWSGSIPVNDEVVYYHAAAGEDAQDAIYKMIECMVKARMIPDVYRTCTYTDYKIPEQELIPLTEDMWLIPFLNGYYAFEGKDMLTMQQFIDMGEPVTEDGLISFFAQGSDEQYYHILMVKDGVYRLQRLDNMRSEQ